ncbi:thioesterase II family protein [Streptomyces sp. NPDC087300]|uniref:thioesterase II family protein n=1 Tax=Streptomyces sp. NPDC087300 TaxID=3365780 RepID=UPI003811B0F7
MPRTQSQSPSQVRKKARAQALAPVPTQPQPRARRGRGATWVRTLRAAARPRARLVCFPHSGGSTASYAHWAAALPSDVELLAVQFPGRGDRFAERPSGSVRAMAAAVADELATAYGNTTYENTAYGGTAEPAPTAFFGHSLGALVAYETALALRDAGCEPAHLLVSGCAAPHDVRDGGLHRADDTTLWETVTGLGGFEAEVAHDPELRDLLLPTLRADLTANETYRPHPVSGLLSCPVRCYFGRRDPLVDAGRVTEWGRVTAGAFTVLPHPGGHFYADDGTAAGAGTGTTTAMGAGTGAGTAELVPDILAALSADALPLAQPA